MVRTVLVTGGNRMRAGWCLIELRRPGVCGAHDRAQSVERNRREEAVAIARMPATG